MPGNHERNWATEEFLAKLGGQAVVDEARAKRRRHLACFCGVLDKSTRIAGVAWRREGQWLVGRYFGDTARVLPDVRFRIHAGDVGIVFETSRDAGAAWEGEAWPFDFEELAALLQTATAWAHAGAPAKAAPPGPPDPPRPARPREVA